MTYCNNCGHKLNIQHNTKQQSRMGFLGRLRSDNFETSVPWDSTTAIVPQTTYYGGDSVTGASVESQVKIPLFQSVISGVFIGTGLGIVSTWLASLGNVDLAWYTAIPTGIFFYTGFDWLRRASYFNQLLQPEIEIEEAEVKVPQQTPIEISVVNENKQAIKRGFIQSGTDEQLKAWAKTIKLDFKLGTPDLSQARFGGSGKIFSQPGYAKFQKELLELGLVEKVSKSKNSKYKLSQAGYNLVNQLLDK